jgi:hypothetical protein
MFMQPMPMMQPMMQPALVANEPRGSLNNNDLENESGSVGPGDFGRTAFMWFAWNSLFAVIMTVGTFACYQLPSFKNDCETDTDNPGNCIAEESSEFSVMWIIPVIISVLLFGGFMKLSIPIFTSKFIRRTLFKGTPSTKAVNAQGNPVIKLRTTMWAWLVLLALIAQTITLTVVASTVIDDRCRPESIARAKAEGVANFVTRFFGSFAYGAQNNWDYNLVNFVSLFNPRYWLWITLSLAIIYSMMSMTGEQVKKAKQAYKTGKQTALKAGKSASAASRQGLKAGAKAFATTPMKTRGKRVLEAAQKANATIKLQSAARGRAVRAPLQTAKTQAAAAAAFQSAGAQKAATAKMQAGAAAFAGAGKRGTRPKGAVLAAAQKAKVQLDQKERQKKIEAFSQRVKERKGQEAMTRLAQQKAQAIKAKRPASPVPPIRPPPPRPSSAPASSRGTVSVSNRVAAINGGRQPASAAGRRPRPVSAKAKARQYRAGTPPGRGGKPTFRV